LSEVHVVIGAAGDGLVLAAGVPGLIACGAGIFLTTLVSVQFNEEFSPAMIGGDEMTSSGGVDVVAHPAKKNAATNRIANDLDTRSLCGWGNRTQAVSGRPNRPRRRPRSRNRTMKFEDEDERDWLPVLNGSAIIRPVKILVAITGASGALYAQRLLDNLDPRTHEIHVVMSNYAQQVIAEELPGGLRLPDGVKTHNVKSMNAPFASGSNPPDAMVVIPCTMGTMGRIAHGYSEDVLLRAADVVLKERKKLILVPRETPLSLVHVKNMELLLLAGAVILPANPGFYAGPKTIQDVVDTVVARVLDHLGVANKLAPRWAEEKE
jgi:4-hydroxy-3-polyprenylbenzoate decarboxylase